MPYCPWTYDMMICQPLGSGSGDGMFCWGSGDSSFSFGDSALAVSFFGELVTWVSGERGVSLLGAFGDDGIVGWEEVEGWQGWIKGEVKNT